MGGVLQHQFLTSTYLYESHNQDEQASSELLDTEPMSPSCKPVDTTVKRNTRLSSFHSYRILRAVKQRGMSHVYKAVYNGAHGFQCPVAIKMATSIPQTARLIHQEARLLSEASGPHLPRVYDTGRLDDTPYFSMEWIDGLSLRTILKTTAIPIPVLIDLMIQLCDALGALHGATTPIIHRDIKPANIMVSPRGHLTLVDLGISGHIGHLRDTSSYGTVAYMAPEQLQHGPLTPQTDMFSMGAILFELLARRRLYTGTVPQILVQRLQTTTETYCHAIEQHIPQTHRVLTPLLFHCLQSEREKRPESVEVIREVLCTLMHPIHAKSCARKWWSQQRVRRALHS